MRLRIYRTWSWELNCSPYEVRYGGDNPMKLIAIDVLQYLDEEGIWRNVEIVEEEKPEHPREKKKREEYERMQNSWKETFKKIKLMDEVSKKAADSKLRFGP